MEQIGLDHYHHHHTSQTPNPAEQLPKALQSVSTSSQESKKRGLAGNHSQLEEDVARQMTRRGFTAFGNLKSNFFCLCVTQISFFRAVWTQKNPIFSIRFGRLWYVVLDPIMCAIHGHVTWAWTIRLELNGFFNANFICYVHISRACDLLIL